MLVKYAGADVRENPLLPAPSWDAQRRAQYLLRTDVVRPLSVDRLVWPAAPSSPGEALPAPAPWIPIAEVRERAVRSTIGQPYPPVTVVIGAVAQDDAEERILTSEQGMAADVPIDNRWLFLGYDIAERGSGISGLSNCAFQANELAILSRDVWSRRLNEHGLFSELPHAFAFRELTNRRVPEHTPFGVCALWIVP